MLIIRCLVRWRAGRAISGARGARTVPWRDGLKIPLGAPVGAQDAEKCLYLFAPHVAHAHVMSF